MAKKDIKVCRLRSCEHGKYIDTKNDKYVVDGLSYYHEDCYPKRIDEVQQQAKENAFRKRTSTTRKCRYKLCKHNNIIDINLDQYVNVGNRYYHESCYREVQNEAPCGFRGCKKGTPVNPNSDDCVIENDKYYHKDCYQLHKDIITFRDLWYENISDTASFSLLSRIFFELLDSPGITSEYLVFVLRYVLDHDIPLRYPQGLRYVVDRQDIKAAYKKKTTPIISQRQFIAKPDEDAAPSVGFAAFKKPASFSSILGGKK